MSPWRQRAVAAGLVLLVAATGHEVITGKEHWPLSSYPMFSRVETEATVDRLRLYGVTPGGVRVELRGDSGELAPLGESRLRVALGRLEGDPTAQRCALADVFARYEARRAAGEHPGPPLASLAVERLTWRLEPGGERPVELVRRQAVASYAPGTPEPRPGRGEPGV